MITYYIHFSIMTSQELSNMIYDIKEKLTDKEFKDIMDKLSLTHKEEKLYEFQYIEVERNVVSVDGCIKYYELENKRKTCVLYKLKIWQCDFNILEPHLWSKYRVYFSGVGVNTQLNIQHVNMGINEYTFFSDEYVNQYALTTEEPDSEENLGVKIKYDKIIPISLKEL